MTCNEGADVIVTVTGSYSVMDVKSLEENLMINDPQQTCDFKQYYADTQIYNENRRSNAGM